MVQHAERKVNIKRTAGYSDVAVAGASTNRQPDGKPGFDTTGAVHATGLDDPERHPDRDRRPGDGSDSTTYRLEANGPGGTTEASARVTVTMPPSTAASQPSLSELFARNVKDIFFDFNKYEVRADQQHAARADAQQFPLQHPEVKLVIEGHCDDWGSEEYNLGLGDNRSYLLQAGISADRIRTISYGKEKPFCNQGNEQCWQSNRRDHFDFQQ